jgi:hypothetical protein
MRLAHSIWLGRVGAGVCSHTLKPFKASPALQLRALAAARYDFHEYSWLELLDVEPMSC